MAWTGPQAKVMFPPSGNVSSEHVTAIPTILEKYQIDQAKIVKLVPYENKLLLQVTESESLPRRYFHLESLNELINHDEKQAYWLGEHYLKQKYEVSSVEFITEFQQDYPSVNRLLPIYKINYETDDNLSIFVHTDTLALAGISNNWKNFLRSIFQAFHSFSWLDDYESVRVGLIAIMVLTCLAMSITGLMLLIKLKRKASIKQTTRRWHRRIGWVVCIPLLMFSLSGLYHLFHNTLSDSIFGLRLTQNLEPRKWPTLIIPENLKSVPIHQISLVENTQATEISNRYLYRLSISQPESKTLNTREKRFSGRPSEKQSIYLNSNGKQLADMEQRLIIQATNKLKTGFSILGLERVKRFGPTYDFRNKRLPVWEVNMDDENRLFIDPVSMILVDQNTLSQRTERLSFSFLHKWNMLNPIMGRQNRDIAIMSVLALTLGLVLMGLTLHLNRRRKKKINTAIQAGSLSTN